MVNPTARQMAQGVEILRKAVDRQAIDRTARERQPVEVHFITDKTEHDLSNRQRRLLEAVNDLPEPWPTTRPHRSEGEAMSRHLGALRARLDWLVDVEHRYGEEQRGVHQNRGERNALIFALGELAERAGVEASKSTRETRKGYEPEYMAKMNAQFDDALNHGFTVAREREPGVLYHGRHDVEPLRVPVAVWFAVRGYNKALDER